MQHQHISVRTSVNDIVDCSKVLQAKNDLEGEGGGEEGGEGRGGEGERGGRGEGRGGEGEEITCKYGYEDG